MARLAQIVAVAVLFLNAAMARCAAAEGWLGQRVITKQGAVLKATRPNRAADKAVEAKERGEGRDFGFYRVEEADGDWLRLKAERSDSESGWIAASEVVLFERAIPYYTSLIEANPRDGWAFHRCGFAWMERGDHDKSLADYNAAIRIAADDAELFRDRGIIWRVKDDVDRAIADYDAAIRLAPEDALAHHNRGLSWFAKGDLDKAVVDWTDAIRLDPAYTGAYVNRALAWAAKRVFDKAIADYGEAIRVGPMQPDAWIQRAWLWATCSDPEHRDGPRAVESATRGCELTGWTDADKLDTLAAACAEAGDFDAAVKWEEKALALTNGDDGWDEARQRLALYREKKPYQQEPAAPPAPGAP